MFFCAVFLIILVILIKIQFYYTGITRTLCIQCKCAILQIFAVPIATINMRFETQESSQKSVWVSFTPIISGEA